ncbi:hypothetical protein Tco_0667739 [Tanacetum coccineum]
MVKPEPVEENVKKIYSRLDVMNLPSSYKLKKKNKEQRRKHFAAKRAEEKRNKLPTRAQQRSIITDWLENEFQRRQKEIGLVEESSKKAETEIAHKSSLKRAGEELEQESSKKAGGNSQMYLTFGKMLKNFNREDLEVIWSIVKARFKKTEPVNYMDNFLLLNLKTMFEHHVEDNILKNQQGLVKVLNWKLYDSYGVHCVTMQSMLFYLLLEKIYPLTNHTLHQMFNDVKLSRLIMNVEMAFELLRLVKKQLKEGNMYQTKCLEASSW